MELLKEVDFLIDGPFILEQKSLDLHFREAPIKGILM